MCSFQFTFVSTIPPPPHTDTHTDTHTHIMVEQTHMPEHPMTDQRILNFSLTERYTCSSERCVLRTPLCSVTFGHGAKEQPR